MDFPYFLSSLLAHQFILASILLCLFGQSLSLMFASQINVVKMSTIHLKCYFLNWIRTIAARLLSQVLFLLYFHESFQAQILYALMFKPKQNMLSKDVWQFFASFESYQIVNCCQSNRHACCLRMQRPETFASFDTNHLLHHHLFGRDLNFESFCPEKIQVYLFIDFHFLYQLI